MLVFLKLIFCFFFFFLQSFLAFGTEHNNPPIVVDTVDLTDDKSKSYSLKKAAGLYNGDTVSCIFLFIFMIM